MLHGICSNKSLKLNLLTTFFKPPHTNAHSEQATLCDDTGSTPLHLLAREKAFFRNDHNTSSCIWSYYKHIAVITLTPSLSYYVDIFRRHRFLCNWFFNSYTTFHTLLSLVRSFGGNFPYCHETKLINFRYCFFDGSRTWKKQRNFFDLKVQN